MCAKISNVVGYPVLMKSIMPTRRISARYDGRRVGSAGKLLGAQVLGPSLITGICVKVVTGIGACNTHDRKCILFLHLETFSYCSNSPEPTAAERRLQDGRL